MFTMRITVNVEKEEYNYLKEMVRLKKADSISQAVRVCIREARDRHD